MRRPATLLTAAVVAAALVAVCTTTSATAQGAETSHFRFHGQFASAEFLTGEAEPLGAGCPFNFPPLTLVIVFATNERVVTHSGGPPVENWGTIHVSQSCPQGPFPPVVAASGFLPEGALQIDPDLNAASLNATVEVFDSVSGTTIPVDISLSWTANGDPVVEKAHTERIKVPGFHLISRSAGTFQPAVASGTVLVGTRNINFTPEATNPISSTLLGSVRQGDVTITSD